MNTATALERVKQAVARYPSQSAAAEAFGISKQYLSDILRGHRKLPRTVLAKVGLVIRTTIVAEKGSGS